VEPHRSVDICRGPDGPRLCSERNRFDAERAFPHRPPEGPRALRQGVTAYFDWMYVYIPLLSPLALVGVWGSIARQPTPVRRRGTVLLAALALNLTLLAVTFNSVEDRYRLPVDAIIALFAVAAVADLHRGARRLWTEYSAERSEDRGTIAA